MGRGRNQQVPWKAAALVAGIIIGGVLLLSLVLPLESYAGKGTAQKTTHSPNVVVHVKHSSRR